MTTRSLTIAATAVALAAGLGLTYWLLFREPPAPELRPCETGEPQPWDLDADTIADDFEDYASRELDYDLDSRRCDADPSRPVGAYDDGALDSGLRIVGERASFNLLAAEGADWATGPLLHCLNVVADRLWEKRDKKMVIGRLSLRDGGPLRYSVSHQNGLQLEIYYLRKGLGGQPSVDIVVANDEYDEEATRFLMRSLVTECKPQMIEAHEGALGFDLPEVVHNENLRTHFDLVLYPPERGSTE